MKLIAQVKLQTTPDQADALKRTMQIANAVCNRLSEMAWNANTFQQFALHRLAYHPVRAETGLTAQMVVRLIAKVADAYKLDRKTRRTFRPLGAISYDDRILRWYSDRVSIWTVDGRIKLPFVCSDHQREMLVFRQGESELVYADGAFYLLAVCDIPEQPKGTPIDWLGVDFGVKNIAVDSDGTVYSGGQVRGLRHRHRILRKRLQSKGTKSAKRLLKRRRRKESRFTRDVNHCISKRIVADAKRTERGIALEELSGIRERVRLRRHQRAAFHSWSFHQLRGFIEYKARRDGVSVVAVDPRNTSRTCPSCGHCGKENRKTQARFLCVRCNFAGLADHVAAENIRRVAVMPPHAVSETITASRPL